ncbi:outer membrane protein assembly factor BamC [Thalassotalea profundi]|uniref:Outer membrane protein assembly factor BamC n=1 Tax=Thalassotalea profundi TaxID=2036687 RepID=A0ABQ3J124_9GAMM|nr:outer membrane protein assembly factor BamC [Thalassotalea profundi]GHE97988.1 outer membrane protein assembly factor BamC [Thalassotalea profundi]
MNRSIISLSLICIAITACSTVSKKHAIGGFEYASKEESSTLVIPENLEQPKYKDDFVISDKINHKGPIGEQVDIRAPSLALPIAAATRIENESQQIKIWFDKVLEDKDLKTFIYQAIVDELATNQVTLSELDSDKLLYQSSWFTNEKESGWLFTSIEETVRVKFKYQLETKPHGRSVAVIVELTDYEKVNESGQTTEIDLIDKERFEMAMLNEIIAQVDFKYRSYQRENQLLRANQQLVSLGENEKGQAAYIVEMEKDMLWSNMPILFSKYGFDVNDLNESKQIYYVTYTKPETSIWDSFWGDDAPVIDLPEGKYQFHLEESENRTAVSILNEKGEGLTKNTLEEIFDVMKLALSFKDSL